MKKITSRQYAQTLFEITNEINDKVELEKIIGNFFSILIKNNDTSKLEIIINDFNNIWNKEKNIIESEVKIANDLDEETKKDIIKYLKKIIGTEKQMILSGKKDKNILGGFILKYGDRIIDQSIKNKLNDFQNFLKN